MKKVVKKSWLLITYIIIFLTACNSRVDWSYKDKILRQIKEPVFSDRVFDIRDFGAIGDGKADCSDAFKKAIDRCNREGGGKVVVKDGVYLTGAIHLKSNVNLYIDSTAKIIFSTDPNKYLPVVYTRFEGVECMNYSPFIYAYEQKNVAITGKGVLDGQANNADWWKWTGNKKYGWEEGMPIQIRDRDNLFQMAEDGIPVEERVFGAGHYIRTNFIQFYKCENVLIEGIKVINSPMWNIHPVLSRNVIIRNVKVVSHGPNNDGCNPESSKNVLIEKCFFDTGDDCIAIKSGRNADGRRINTPSENIIVRNCTMRDGHGGVVVGSEMTGGVRNVFVENCIMDSPNLNRALRIKTNSRRGGIVENIFAKDLTVGEVSDAVIKINFFYGEGDVGEFTPIVRNIFIENLTSKKSKYALYIKAYKRSPVDNINLKNCRFDGVERENVIVNVTNMNLDEVYINGKIFLGYMMLPYLLSFLE